jgi:cytochrome c553
METVVTFYRGAASTWARKAAEWLRKADEWQQADGPHASEGLTVCLDCHLRSVRNARALLGGSN